MRDEIAAILKCPECDSGALSCQKGEYQCVQCSAQYPQVSGMPWILENAKLNLGQWSLRCQSYLSSIESEEVQLKVAAQIPGILESTKKRLALTLQGKVEHRKALEKLFTPLLEFPIVENLAFDAFKVKLPEQVQLMGYYANVFRDWSWEGNENESAISVLEELEPDLAQGQKWLVLGAGAGRLVYDCHKKWSPKFTVATDINPYLFLVFDRMLKGNSLTLFDFPMAPVDGKSRAVKNRLKLKEKAPNNIFPVFSDGMNPGFKDASFDIVLTPWFIDIVPQDTRTLAKRVNRLLPLGGRWLNFGSLVYKQGQPHLDYGPEEILEILAESGFEINKVSRREIPYLSSSSSAQVRREQVFAFSASKTSEVEAPAKYQAWPEWLHNVKSPVPKLANIDRTYSINQLYNTIMKHIDGRASIAEIGAKVAPALGVTNDQGAIVLQQLLASLFEAERI